MKLMGMSAAAHWTSWFLLFFIYLIIASAIYTFFLSIKIGGKKSVLVYSDPSLTFVFLIIYSLSIICYCFCISTVANKGTDRSIQPNIHVPKKKKKSYPTH
jgi:hypothetical protein